MIPPVIFTANPKVKLAFEQNTSVAVLLILSHHIFTV